jgi:NADH-quinone oxidoreductase subunit C
MSEESKEAIPASNEASVSASETPVAKAPAVPEPAKAATEKFAVEAQPVQAAAPPLTGDKPAAAKAVAPAADKPSAATVSAPVKPAVAAVKPAAPAPAKPAAPPAAKPPVPKPEPWDSELVRGLKSQYGSGIREASIYAGQKYLVVDSSLVYQILCRMRDEQLFDYCVDITAVHYPKREAQFDIVYILYSFHSNERLRIKTQIKDGERLRSAFSLWPTANWLEREVFDMFGIQFDEHPELKRILMPDDWRGHPLRKDYGILQQDAEWIKTNIGIESAQ